MSQRADLDDWRRWVFRFLVVFCAIYWYYMTQYVLPRYWLRGWNVYLNAIVTSAVIASSDLIIQQVNLAPLYILVIIGTAMVWSQRAALFAAAVASALNLLVALSRNNAPLLEVGLLLDPAVYFVSALLVSQLRDALTKRWQTAAAEAEQRRNEIERRNRELESLGEISQAFESLEDVAATFRLLTERIARLLDTEICVLARVDSKTARVSGMPPGFGLTDQQIENLQYQVDDDIIRLWDIDRNECLIVDDPARLPTPLAELAQSLNVHQLLAARLMWRSKPIGLIFVANRLSGEPFKEKDARLLTILANQVATVVENARLYQQAQTNLRDITRLYAISAELAIRSKPTDIPKRVVRAIAEALNAPSATIALINPSSGRLEYTATLGVPQQALETPFRENGVGMKVARTGKARFIEDIQTAREVSPVARVWGYRASACLPIQHIGKCLGVLYVNYPEPHTFTDIEKNMLAIFASQTAIALENAQLLRVEERRSTELGALANLSRLLAETMDLEGMFRVVEQQVHASMPAADSGTLLLYDEKSGNLIPRVMFGFKIEIARKMKLLPGESISGIAFAEDRSILLTDPAQAKAMRDTMRPENRALFQAAAARDENTKSLICVPIHYANEKLGVIVLDNYKSSEAFTSDDLRLLEGIADRFALAMRNAQLFAAGRRRAAQLSTINQLGHHVTSILDMEQLAATLVRLVRDTFGYRYVHLFINDPDRRMAVLRAEAGAVEQELGSGEFALGYGIGIVGWVALHGETLVANDVAQEPRFVSHPATPDTSAEIAVPLVAGANVIGVLDIQSEQLNAFDATDVATLETLANQVAIAIENARLYGETQEQAHRDSLTQVFNHGYFLEQLEEEITRTQRELKPLSLIMLDVDYFKDYNDTYGHVLGDEVLSKIVQAIRTHVKRTDLVGRWGGEEFCIALLDTDTHRALRVAQRIRQTLAATQIEKKDGTPIPPPTISQGIATVPMHARDSATLIDLADAALYRAKTQGRDQVYVAGGKC